MGRKRPVIVVCILASVAVLSGLATLLFMGRELDLLAGSPVTQADPERQAEAQPTPAPASRGATPTASKAEDADVRVRRLHALRDDPGARSDMQELTVAMVADASAEVRLTAFEVARHLAAKEGGTQLLQLLKSTIRSPHSEVRREALRTCTTHPQFDLIDELLHLASQTTEERFLAVQALAYLDDDRAQMAVLDVARSESVPRSQRMRAVALLTRTQLTAGVLYLQELAKGDDSELRDCALAALSAMQQRYRR